MLNKKRGFTQHHFWLFQIQKWCRVYPRTKSGAGFTLIELLVVIAILGLLATLAITSLNNARVKSRDAKRLADITQLQKALDLYYDNNNSYIVSGNCGSNHPLTAWCNSAESLSDGHWIRNGTTNLSAYLLKDPIDPKSNALPTWPVESGMSYFYLSNGGGGSGQWYIIVFGLENHDHEFQNYDGVVACDGTYYHYGNGSDGIITVGRSCQ